MTFRVSIRYEADWTSCIAEMTIVAEPNATGEPGFRLVDHIANIGIAPEMVEKVEMLIGSPVGDKWEDVTNEHAS